MTHEDEQAFLDAIRQFGPLALVYSAFSDPAKMEVHLFHSVGTVAGDDNLGLVNAPSANNLKHEFFSTSSTYCLDLAESEIVQFNRCRPIQTWIANGRLWFDENSFKGVKSQAFLKWANALLEWIRINYKKNNSGDFIAPYALELANQGKLQLGPTIAPLSIEEQKRILGIK